MVTVTPAKEAEEGNQMDFRVWKEDRRHTGSPSRKQICPEADEDGVSQPPTCLGAFQGAEERGNIVCR